jgi:ribonuclease HI
VTTSDDVYELLRLKMELSEEVAKVWLTTAEMGFSLTDEEHMVVCPKDLREGTTTDRYLAPAITRFAIKVGNQGCYDFPGETWAGDGSAHKGEMGAGSVCLKQQGRHLEVKVGREEEEGVSSPRPELAALAQTLQATSAGTDLLYLCDSERTLTKVSRWIGRGLRTTLAGDANADIMKMIIECLRARVMRGVRKFIVKIKAHRGEPQNEEADTVAERAPQLPEDSKQWTTRTPRLLYEWTEKGLKTVSTW